MEGSASSCQVGPDGLTKQQRYLQKNRQKINAKNAHRKLLRQEEAEIANTLEVDSEDVIISESRVEQPQRDSAISVDQSTQTELENPDQPRPEGYYTSQEYYASQEFDDLMHEKLMKLERLDRAKKAEEAFEKGIQEYEDFSKALKQRWTIHSGWKYPRRFKGSRLEERCRQLQGFLQEADELNCNLLQETPPSEPEWFEIFLQVREIVAKRGHLQVVYHTLMDTV
ncbi:hypothetical protein JR316_0006702 [Psilocybe cubensis]|uniref:Uncharacterized protein n=2 Tax=Psilocybe cubensis TaxID=181762 RepID=A0ACB8GXA7_PSICU|nr:hypothetical protein JR316_0006702 [Psilocybe cubensis]KAH9480105.1 hypothetical protein JR316_0006702 [Psilocybe cubensis]